MIKLSLDRHDFVAAVEGFAKGSHLRQHVWREIVFKSIPQMTNDEIDFFWFIFRRNLWDCYFGEFANGVGAEDYLHTLAALHRGNRSYVRFTPSNTHGKGKSVLALCYTFMDKLRPLYLNGETELQCFDDFVPGEWVINLCKIPMPENKYVEDGKMDWWTDLSVYNKQLKY